jgi:hypothetical protein
MIQLDFSGMPLRTRNTDGAATFFDPIRKKWVAVTPEEHVRQLLIAYLSTRANYPPAYFSVEKMIRVGTRNKRFDLVVFDRAHQPWMLAECKAPEVALTDKAFHQLLDYQSVVKCRYWLLTNGLQTFCADASDPSAVNWLEALPSFDV